MKIALFAALAAVGACLSGCATIVEGTTQSVSINTMPVDGAKCELQNSEGTWFITSPGSVVVHKTKNDLKVTCKKDGYQDANLTVPSKFGAATAGNILAGGVIGLGIDAASGANYSYSPNTSVRLIPSAVVNGEAVILPAAAVEPEPMM